MKSSRPEGPPSRSLAAWTLNGLYSLKTAKNHLAKGLDPPPPDFSLDCITLQCKRMRNVRQYRSIRVTKSESLLFISPASFVSAFFSFPLFPLWSVHLAQYRVDRQEAPECILLYASSCPSWKDQDSQLSSPKQALAGWPHPPTCNISQCS